MATPDQHPVEIILARGMMSNLSTPAFLVDPAGTLIFYNEAAEEILGLTFAEAGAMPAQDWGGRFEPLAPDGRPLGLEELPLSIALGEGRPAHAVMRIRSATGVDHEIDVCAFPIVGRTGPRGAMAIFWDRTG